MAFQVLPIADVPPPLEGLDVSRLPSSADRVRFELELTIRLAAGGLRALVSYNSSLWDRESIVRIAEYYQAVLHAIVETPDATLAELSRIGDRDREEQLAEWSGLSRPGQQGVVHEVFDRCVSASPRRLRSKAEPNA